MRCLTPRDFLEIKDIFLERDILIEIGFGRGEFLKGLAERYPSSLILGIEFSNEGLEKAGKRLKDFSNVILVKSEGYFFLKYLTPSSSVDGIFTIFPDPFIKHEKRRLVNKFFLKEVGRVLKKGGFYFFITDWRDYYEDVLENIRKVVVFREKNLDFEVDTRFKRKWERKGRSFFKISVEKIVDSREPFSFPEASLSIPVKKAFIKPHPFIVKEGDWIYKIEEVFEGEDGFVLRTLIKRIGTPEIKQFVKIDSEGIHLLPTGFELAVPPLKRLFELIKERFYHEGA